MFGRNFQRYLKLLSRYTSTMCTFQPQLALFHSSFRQRALSVPYSFRPPRRQFQVSIWDKILKFNKGGGLKQGRGKKNFLKFITGGTGRYPRVKYYCSPLPLKIFFPTRIAYHHCNKSFINNLLLIEKMFQMIKLLS